MSSRPPERPPGPGKPPGSPTPTLPAVAALAPARRARRGRRDLPLHDRAARTTRPRRDLTYSEFSKAGEPTATMKSVSYDPSNGNITGDFKTAQDGKKSFTSSGPNNDLQPTELKNLADQGVNVKYVRESSNPLLQHPDLGAARCVADHRVLRVDEPTRAGPDGRGDEHRPQPGQGLRRREAEDDVLRRRRLRAGEAGDHRGRRLPEEPGQVQGDRRAHPARRAARRSSGHRQDAARPRRRR